MNKVVIYGKTRGYGEYFLMLPQRLYEGKPVCLEGHLCSNDSWAKIDLTERNDRKSRLDMLFGEDNWEVEFVVGCDIEEMYTKCDEINKDNEQLTFDRLNEVYGNRG